MPSAFGARLGMAATIVLACSCTALLGLDGKHYGSGGGVGGVGGVGGALGSSTTHASSSGMTGGAAGGTPSSGTSSAVGAVSVGSTTSSSGGGTCAGADLTSDPNNCGKCGHDCLGGSCVGGACQPVAVVQQYGNVVESLLALDSNWVYFAIRQGGHVVLQFHGVHDLPSATTGTLATIDGAGALAAADGYVGWTTSRPSDAGTVNAIAAFALKAQGSPVSTQLYAGTGTIGPMIGDGQLFALATNQEILTGMPGGLSSATSASNVGSMAADSTHLYWMNSSGEITAGNPMGTVSQLVLIDPGGRYIATHDNNPNLYWVLQTGTAGSIRTVPKGINSPVLTIGTPTLLAQSVAADADAVYVSSLPSSCPGTMGNGRIQRVDTTSKETLLPGVICPFAVVTDDVCIYWTDPNAGGLMRLAK